MRQNLSLIYEEKSLKNLVRVILKKRVKNLENGSHLYAKTVYGEDEINAVVKCLNESTQMGNYSRKFEKEIAKLFSKEYCLYVNSGSSAYIWYRGFKSS